ncbi:hypothetical protein Tco_1411037, partial [Tanacetum coccineum]
MQLNVNQQANTHSCEGDDGGDGGVTVASAVVGWPELAGGGAGKVEEGDEWLSSSFLDLPWSELELHLSGDEDLRGDKEVFVYLVGKCSDGGACKVVGWLLDDMVV